MNEAINAAHNINDSFALHTINSSNVGAILTPYFSMRKLKLVYNELLGTNELEFANFDEFKQIVLSSPVPQLELSKWQAIASRR